jgi:hypothetical protein
MGLSGIESGLRGRSVHQTQCTCTRLCPNIPVGHRDYVDRSTPLQHATRVSRVGQRCPSELFGRLFNDAISSETIFCRSYGDE